MVDLVDDEKDEPVMTGHLGSLRQGSQGGPTLLGEPGLTGRRRSATSSPVGATSSRGGEPSASATRSLSCVERGAP